MLNFAFPSGVGLPKLANETKRLLRELGLGCKKFIETVMITYCIEKIRSIMKHATNVVHLDENLMIDMQVTIQIISRR